MNPQYKEWIEKNIEGDGYGQCAEATKEMEKAFPELKRVRGHYYCVAWGEREHWWLVDADKNIVDPTLQQFPSKGLGTYVEWDESSPEPTGMCPNCGDYCFNGNDVCSEECFLEYKNYLENIV